MQPEQGLGFERRLREPIAPARLAVASRRRALERLESSVREGRDGPLLITGEAGAGKSWLADRLVEGLPAGWRALTVELTSTLDALEFLRLVADALGLPMTDRLGSVRLRIRAALEDDATEGRQWLLTIDEAHRGSPVVWEELDILAKSLGRASGFGAMVILGRTELVRGLASRPLDGWAVRMGLHVHLMPLDLDEARELLAIQGRSRIGSEQALENLHRDTLGNPRLLLRLAESWDWPHGADERTGRTTMASGASVLPGAPYRPADRESMPIERGTETQSSEDRGRAKVPSLIPSRPPIRMEEGLVEVGWDGDMGDDEAESESPINETDASLRSEAHLGEQLVEDRYAALQAWTEWTRNRERATVTNDPSLNSVGSLGQDPSDAVESFPEEQSIEDVSTSVPAAGTVRAETSHDHAPYSQLFTRLRQSRQG